MKTQQISGLADLIDRYEVFLIDAWGVLHDGRQLYPGVRKTLLQLQRADKAVIVLSNAARRHVDFKQELAKLGLGNDLYSTVVTSGELSWRALHDRLPAIAHFGSRFFYLGPDRSRGVIGDLDREEVHALSEADFIVNTGAQGNQPDASSFEPLLQEASKLGLPMLCANPDQLAVRGGVMGISAGAIARLYQQTGGEVIYFGKPHAPIYEACFELYSDIPRERFLMLGDGLATDIKGANRAGIDSVFLSSGIHHSELEKEPQGLQTLSQRYQVTPTYVMHSMLPQTP